jgi:hypothetical protein
VEDKSSNGFFSAPAQDLKLKRRDHLTFKGNQARGRHGWLRLTPAYSLHLVQKLVDGLSTRDIVLDPFCGTGTTALSCAQHGIACDTVDVNPFLIWFTSAKCASYSAPEIERLSAFAHAIKTASLRKSAAWTPPIQDIQKWWSEPILTALGSLFEHVTGESNSRSRDLLRIAFCRTAIETAAVSFGHQSMSFRKGEPQATLFSEPAEQKVLSHFLRALSDVAQSAAEPLAEVARAVLGDSRELDSSLPVQRYTAVITSPPYPNRMSYIRELRPYMYWLGYLNDGRQAGELDWKAIGGTWGCATSLVSKWESDPSIEVPWPGFAHCVGSIKKHSDLLGRYVHKYFEDAVLHVRSLSRVLTAGARVHYVVGNSKFYDVLLPTEEIYAAIFGALGYSGVAVERIRKRTSKKELFEFVVHAKKE